MNKSCFTVMIWNFLHSLQTYDILRNIEYFLYNLLIHALRRTWITILLAENAMLAGLLYYLHMHCVEDLLKWYSYLLEISFLSVFSYR